MKSFMSICLDKSSKTPIYKQLGDALLHLIEEGILPADSRLPPIRKMSEGLKINNSTVVNAYKYLEQNHAVYSFLGSGTYVSPLNAEVELSNQTLKKTTLNHLISETGIFADFASTNMRKELFPKEEIKQAFDRAIDKNGDRAFINTSGRGYEPLIDALHERFQKDRISTSTENILLTETASQAYELIAKAFVNRGDYIIAEKPVQYSRIGAFIDNNANILQIPLNKDGLDLNILESLLKVYRPKLLLVSTCLQMPTNVCYSNDNKRNVLDLCNKYGASIIEEDTYGDLVAGERKSLLKSIKALDYRGQVVYVKNITKIALPWLNMCALIMPKKTMQVIKNADLSGISTNNSLVSMILLELFISNTFDILLNKFVNNHEKQNKIIAKYLAEISCKFVNIDSANEGIGFWVRMNRGHSGTLASYCAARGVLIIPSTVYFGGDDDTHFRLNFTNAACNCFGEAMKIIKDGLIEACK